MPVQAGAYSSYVSLGLMKYDFDHSGEDGAMKVAEVVKYALGRQSTLYVHTFSENNIKSQLAPCICIQVTSCSSRASLQTCPSASHGVLVAQRPLPNEVKQDVNITWRDECSTHQH